MPVSPQDFALWSQMTGRPYPQSPAERMALAPEVYSYTRSIGRQGGPTMGPVRRTVDVIGKAALAAGALAGAGYLVSKYGGDNPPDDDPPTPPTGFGALALDTEPEVHPPEARYTPNVNSDVARNSGDITTQPTSGHYHQNLNINQTGIAQDLKGLSPQKPTQVPSELKPATQSEVIASRQTFAPGTEADMIGEDAVQKAIAFRKSKAYDVMQGQYPGLRDTDTEMLGGSETVSAPSVSSANVEVLGNSETVSAPQPKLADLFESQLRGMAQSDARLYRSAGERIGSMRQILNEAGGAPQGASQESQPKIAPAVGPSPEEIRDLDKTLLLAHGATTNRIQREAMRDEMLGKKYGGQAESGPEYVGTGETVTAAAQPPAPKEFLHSAVQGVKQRAHLSKYGYDPEQGFGEKQAPGMEQVGPAHADLMAEQMQHELGRQAEREAIYKRISPSPTADLSYLAKEGPGKFFKPASYVMP